MTKNRNFSEKVFMQIFIDNIELLIRKLGFVLRVILVLSMQKIRSVGYNSTKLGKYKIKITTEKLDFQ